jgi:hypothetical protein
MPYTDLTGHPRAQHFQPHAGYADAHSHRQAFHHPQTTLGATGHLLHMGMVAAPLVIGELIHDPEKKWRVMRIVPVLGALASEGLWTLKIAHDRKREDEARAALEDCRAQHCR